MNADSDEGNRYSGVFDQMKQTTRDGGSVRIAKEELKVARTNPLTLAAFNGEIIKIQSLLDTGANPNIQLKGETTPLACAAGNGHIDVVQLLLDHGAQVNAAKGAALNRAADGGHLELVMVLLNAGAEVESRNSGASRHSSFMSDYSALEYAVHGGVGLIVKTLLSHGADPNGGTGSALRMAATHGHLEIVSELLARGADVTAANKYGYTALGFAAVKGHAAVVQTLLDNGAEVTQAVLRVAEAQPSNEAIIHILRRGGAA